MPSWRLDKPEVKASFSQPLAHLDPFSLLLPLTAVISSGRAFTPAQRTSSPGPPECPLPLSAHCHTQGSAVQSFYDHSLLPWPPPLPSDPRAKQRCPAHYRPMTTCRGQLA